MSEIRSRYPFLAMANLVGGGFLVVAVFAFNVTAAVTLGFAVSIPLAIFGLVMALSATSGANSVERLGVATLGTLTCLVASWTVVASLVFAPSVARWLIFASACAHVALSLASLLIREVSTERVVHHLEVSEREALAAR